MDRIMAVDWGEKRVGIALSDESRTIASPHCMLQRSSNLAADLGRIADLVRENGVGMVVIGVPLRLDGSHGPAAEKVLQVVEQLSRLLEVPLVTRDERLSTAEAQRSLIGGDVPRKKRRQLVNQVAASLFLQSFLDSGAWRDL